jgi:hypothetical protein
MWKPASSIKMQFFVKSRSESFHSINHSNLVCRFPTGFLISGSNIGFFTVMSIVFRIWLLSCDFDIVKSSNRSVKLFIISSEYNRRSLSSSPFIYSLCSVVNELFGRLFCSNFLYATSSVFVIIPPS